MDLSDLGAGEQKVRWWFLQHAFIPYLFLAPVTAVASFLPAEVRVLGDFYFLGLLDVGRVFVCASGFHREDL